MAEREGFEPSIRFRIHTFQACAFDHSAISPAFEPIEKWEPENIKDFYIQCNVSIRYLCILTLERVNEYCFLETPSPSSVFLTHAELELSVPGVNLIGHCFQFVPALKGLLQFFVDCL